MVWIRFYMVRNGNWQRSFEGCESWSFAMSTCMFFDGISQQQLADQETLGIKNVIISQTKQEPFFLRGLLIFLLTIAKL